MQHKPDSHDSFFKQNLKNLAVAKDFLKAFLPPEISAKIDYSSIAIESDSFIDADLVKRYSDMIFRVKMDDRLAYLYLLVEHQSSPDPNIVFRVIGYVMRLMLEKVKQTKRSVYPLVYPFVYYHGESTPYPYPLDWQSAFDDAQALLPSILAKPLQLVDLNQVPDQDLAQHKWLYAFALTMKYIRNPALSDRFILALSHLNALPKDQAVIDLILGTVSYVFNKADQIKVEYIEEKLKEAVPPPLQEKIMTIAEQLKSIGREEGIEKGRLEGINIGEESATQRNLLRLANKRFGDLPASVIKHVETASMTELDRLFDRLLDVQTAQDWLAD